MKAKTLLALLMIVVFVSLVGLTACGQAAPTPAPQAAAPTAAPPEPTKAAPTEAPAAPEPAATEAPALGVGEEMKATKPWKIGYVIKNTTNPYYVRMTEGAEGAGRDFEVEVTVLAPQKPDNVEEQIRIMEDLIQQKVDGIVIAPTDTNGLAPVVEQAVAAGIPVIAIGTPLNTDKIVTFTGFDNITAGRLMGEWVVEALGGSGKVLILEGPLGQKNAEDRRNGFLEGFQAGQVELLDQQSAQWKRSEALRITEDWLQRFPEIDAIVASNDEMGLGASEAVLAAGRQDVIITGFDANNDARVAIKEGRMHATIDQVPDRQARQAVQLMIRHLEKGETFPPALPWQDITMITQQNIDQFLK